MRINPARTLPDEFLNGLRSLEKSYLTAQDPIRQSGFGGGERRWRAEREPILEAVESDGDFFDIGCANGYLLECLIRWGQERGVNLTPYGLDIGPGLISLARQRLPEYKGNFYIGNGWDWIPSRKFRYVYSVFDCVPEEYLEEYIYRLMERYVAPGGRLILGAYGSKSQSKTPFDIAGFVESIGLVISGSAVDGTPSVSQFVWLDRR
jgi:SAM-dependent methyltransferase